MTLGRPRTVTDEAILTALARAISRVGPARPTLEPHAGVEGQASDRYRVAADEGAVRSSSAAMNASTCPRRMLAIAVGMP